jgi:hypothetical protein
MIDVPSWLCELYLTTKPLVSFANLATSPIASISFGSFANCSTSAMHWNMDSMSSSNFNRKSLRLDSSSNIYNKLAVLVKIGFEQSTLYITLTEAKTTCAIG